ncbi:MAG TPA: oligopeptide/dipeptide ABC transporter ATP-binding protein, partial [Ornithinibacter sp.]|nr:oligopeptide/dipeptide ABC transporter ATP-binding protein [Ornithinibacter sp.]
ESGCGKSTLAKLLMNLEQPTAGSIRYQGRDVLKLSAAEQRKLRRNIQLVMQDPYTSLNPRMTVGDIIGEPFEIHKDVVPKGGRRARVQELLDLVGLNPEHIHRYPHQFSGGQRQRIGIARGIALNPKVLVCDEPVSALDVSVQAQVVNLMEKLQDELGLAYVFIAHDLSVVRHISDRVGVMYLGRLAELGEEDEVYSRPTHPYTQALLSAVPVPDPTLRGKRDQIVLVGDVPSPANPPSGCRFHTRCWKAQEICSQEEPQLELRSDGAGEHLSACHFAEARTIVETVDVSDLEPDSRFTTTDFSDLDDLGAGLGAAGGGEDLDSSAAESEAERSDALHADSDTAPQDGTRLVDEQPGDQRPPNG